MMSNWNFSYAITEFPEVPVLTDGTSINSDGLLIRTNGQKAGSNVGKTYAFYYNTAIYFITASTESCTVSITYNSNSIGSTVSLGSTDSNYPNYKYASTTVGPSSGFNTSIPVFGSVSAGLAAFDDFYSNLPAENVVRYPYTFQNGYLFVFDLGQSGAMYSFDLTSKSEEYSNIGDNPFPDTNQSYWFENSLPETEETTIPSTSAITIHWDKGDKTNIFGQTQDMKATISGTSTGKYLYIYNPPAHYKWSGSSNPSASETINYPVIINGVSVGDNFYVYDSRALLFDFNQGGKVQGTVTGETGYGSVSTDGAISVVTSNGAVYTQNSGGSTDISGANGGSLAENINGLKQAFDDAINNIILLISTPVEYIQRLIGLGGEFVQSIASFFDFLPEPLGTMVITGISVVIVIGVLHTLL